MTRPDLADRAMFLTLEPIPDECRRPEAELWAAFEAERPGILGALLDAVVEGLGGYPPKLLRMANLALCATARETAFWPAGATATMRWSIDARPIAAAVRTVMARRTEWTAG